MSVDPASVPRLTTVELRTIVRTVRSAAGATDALSELLRRNPRGLNRLLGELALDDQADQSVRVSAVAALGRNTLLSSLDGLRATLAADDEAVKQRAIERLGKVGTADDVETLKSVRTGNRTTQRVLRTAKSFLSYRHRLGAYRIDEPTHRLAADAGATPVRSTTPTVKMLNAMELVAPSVPGIALGPTPLRRLVCGGDEYALMWNDALGGGAATTLADRQGIPAVLLSYNHETGVYSPAYYFFTDPTSGGRVRIAGLRGSGRVGLAGQGEIDAEALSFELNATETPIEHPLTVAGRYDFSSGAVRFDVSLVESRFSARQQRQRKQPRRARRPA